MKTCLFVALVTMIHPAFAQRIINDSPMEIMVRVYKPNAKKYSSYRYALVVGKGASVDLESSRKGIQLQIWTSKNMTPTTQRLAAGKVYTSFDVILVNPDYSVAVNPTREVPHHPDSLPVAPTRHEVLRHNQGITGSEYIEDVNGFRLVLNHGKLQVQNKNQESCLTIAEEEADYVIFQEGYLYFYKRDAAGAYRIIRQFGNYRPGAELIVNGCKIEVIRNGFVEWSIPEKLSTRSY